MNKPPQKPKDLARKPRGFPDKREALLNAEQEMIDRVTSVYRKWGFEALDTGAFEYADALGKFLPDSDRPNEGVFALQDDDEQWISLRPAPAASASSCSLTPIRSGHPAPMQMPR